MKIINPSYTIETPLDYQEILRRIEACGRTCYKSSMGDAEKFCVHILERGHESVIEHVSITVRFVVDRGVSHELVRHRLASFSQESTRYCNYSAERFESEITFIRPLCALHASERFASQTWFDACQKSETDYLALLGWGWKPEEARSVLNNSLKTEVVVTANLREWRHILSLRASQKAHPEMRRVMQPLLVELRIKLPALFFDILPEIK